MDVVLRYIGDGTYIPGVPARDLRADEAALHSVAIQEYETAMGIKLYAPVEPPAPTATPKRKAATEEVTNG